MSINLKWLWVFITSIAAFLLFVYFMLNDKDVMFDGNIKNLNGNGRNSGNELPLPEVLEDLDPSSGVAEFHLTAQEGSKEFLGGTNTDTFGYNGDFLGPIIRVKRGEKVNIKVKNKLGEPTTVHWHGLEVPGRMDGGPHTAIMPDEVWEPSFTIDQPAATLWYHPHLLHKTGEQVYKGLAGLFYIDDEQSDKLDIPKDYGKNDFPLVIQDRRFKDDGEMPYDVGMHDMMFGLLGDTVLVNGAINPQLTVPRGKVRFRLLNGSNARIYQFFFTDRIAFHQIATDGGFLEEPVELSKVKLSPGERAEIIVDFSDLREGEKIKLQSDAGDIMEFVAGGNPDRKRALPNRLVNIERIAESEASITRRFEFRGMGPMVNINGKQMNIERIDEKVQLHSTELWEIRNVTMGMSMGRNGDVAHPFHAHGVQFQIIERDGNPPPDNERGWKDTILVHSGETVRAIARFKQPGIFMYHCHILEHEDAGMMGQFLVED